MTKTTVSIIIPTYNAANRIEATLSSIAAQDYENMEIIVADDGSSDNTCGVVENILKNSARDFKIIRHEANMGVSAARNTGLGAASGEYVVFFDADDLADQNFVSVLLKTITENDSDAAFCGFRFRFEDTGKEREVPVKLNLSRLYSAEELTVMYILKRIKPAIWSTIFKTSFLKTIDLEFTVGCRFGEDSEFLTKALSRCDLIHFSTGCHYIYVRHKDATSSITLQTLDKYLHRYSDSAEATCRAARYLMEHAESPKVRDVAMNFMLAKGLIETLNVAARRHYEAEFYRKLSSPETRRALLASHRFFFQKPEVFIKAAFLLIAPRLYFRMLSKPFKVRSKA